MLVFTCDEFKYRIALLSCYVEREFPFFDEVTILGGGETYSLVDFDLYHLLLSQSPDSRGWVDINVGFGVKDVSLSIKDLTDEEYEELGGEKLVSKESSWVHDYVLYKFDNYEPMTLYTFIDLSKNIFRIFGFYEEDKHILLTERGAHEVRSGFRCNSFISAWLCAELYLPDGPQVMLSRMLDRFGKSKLEETVKRDLFVFMSYRFMLLS